MAGKGERNGVPSNLIGNCLDGRSASGISCLIYCYPSVTAKGIHITFAKKGYITSKWVITS